MSIHPSGEIPAGGPGETDPVLEFRSMLGRRLQAEEVISAELDARRRAMSHADDALRHAEALARELEEDARETARATVAEATARAEQIVTDAESRAARVTAAAETALARTLEDIDALANGARAALVRARTELSAGERSPERRRNPFRSVH